MKKVSLRDVAEELGVSKTLVSLVMNGKAEENRISQEVIEKVKRVAKEKGYEPNQFAKALRTGKSMTIGLIVADISNSFYSKMARSVEDEAYSSNYTVLFGSSDEDPDKAEKLIKVMLDRQIDGMIISPTIRGHQSIHLIERHKIPYILVDRPLSGIDSSFVGVDNLEASFHAVTALIDQGCKKIAHLNFYQELGNMKDRFTGYEKAHQEAGLELDPSLVKYVSNDKAISEIHDFIDSIDKKADAYFFANNEIALIAIKYLIKSDIDPNTDVCIACFDDHEAFHLLKASIGVIKQPVVEMGKKAIELLLAQIDGNSHSNQTIQLNTQYAVLNKELVKK